MAKNSTAVDTKLFLDKVVAKDLSGGDRIVFRNEYGFKLIVPANGPLFTPQGIKSLEDALMHIAELTALTT